MRGGFIDLLVESLKKGVVGVMKVDNSEGACGNVLSEVVFKVAAGLNAIAKNFPVTLSKSANCLSEPVSGVGGGDGGCACVGVGNFVGSDVESFLVDFHEGDGIALVGN